MMNIHLYIHFLYVIIYKMVRCMHCVFMRVNAVPLSYEIEMNGSVSMSCLDRLNREHDLRAWSFEDLNALAAEIRTFLLRHVSQTGGHLASNLGAVELTIAIHNIFDTEKDRVIFDVGHQSYVHKILTDRMNCFDTLRTYGGIAGFPKPSESKHDAFTAGHASSAVSTALGIARARTLCGEDYRVVAVVGDGAATGGLFYEGMNDAGASHEPLIVILNDNGMSISDNVGGISKHLSVLHLRPEWYGFKKRYRKLMKKLPCGKYIYKFTHKVKDRLRTSLIGTNIFEEMGFLYLGPVDGHDIRKMSYLLTRAKEENCPVVLHVLTKKGKGYRPAEDTPSDYHGVGKFDPTVGVSGSTNSFSAVCGEVLTDLAGEHENLCAITAGMCDGTGLTNFAKQYPDRFFDVGIAEGHAVSMAAGLAKQGMLPVFSVYSTFLQRAYDMILQDVALQQLHTVFCVDRAGLVGEDGETHHGVFDVGYLRHVPGMTVFAPANYAELRRMLRTAVTECSGPVAVRYPRGREGAYHEDAQRDCILEGSDVTLVTYGCTVNAVLSAAQMLAVRGISAEVIKLGMIKPLQLDALAASAAKTGRMIIVEEQNASCCIAAEVLAALKQRAIMPAARMLNLGDGYTPHGAVALLQRDAGIDAEAITAAAMEVMEVEP